MKPASRIALIVAGSSIAFSVLCSVFYFVFTAAFLLSVLFGAVGVACAVAAKAWRTAMVVAAFAVVPLAQLLVEELFEAEFLVFIPAAVATSAAAWALIDYSSWKRAPLGTAG